MDWSVELHPDDGGKPTLVDLSNFPAVLAHIKEHEAKDSPGTLKIHARQTASDEERAAVVAAGGIPMWPMRTAGSN
jgi:hypothetical protein